MRVLPWLIAACCLHFEAFAQSPFPPPATASASEADLGAVKALITRFVDASNANDVHAFAAVFAEGADFTNVFGQPAKGRNQIEAFHAPYYREPRQPGLPSFTHAHLAVLDSQIRFIRSDVAAVDIRWEQTDAVDPDGKPWGRRLGLMNWIATREDGTWSITVMHNLELPRIPERWERK